MLRFGTPHTKTSRCSKTPTYRKLPVVMVVAVAGTVLTMLAVGILGVVAGDFDSVVKDEGVLVLLSKMYKQ